VNAASFLAVVAAVAITRLPVRRSTLPREHATAAVQAGGRYVRNSPVLLALIARAVAFVFLAGAIWALLPLVARYRLGLGSGGYGLLLACVGIGALLAATFGPSLRQRMSPRAVYALASLAVAAGATLLATTHAVPVAVVALVLAGAAWITGLGLLSSGYQSQLPAWVKARSFAYYLVAFQGANGVGALCLGAVAEGSSVVTALLVVAVGLAAVALVTWRLPLPDAAGAAGAMAEPLPLPDPGDDLDVSHGPVLVIVEYNVAAGRGDEFIAMTTDLHRMRRRPGASRWHLHRGVEDPDLFTETFIVGSWEEHERQHARLQRTDSELLQQIDTVLRASHPRLARHAVGVRAPRKARRLVT
jgi:MFS family permease